MILRANGDNGTHFQALSGSYVLIIVAHMKRDGSSSYLSNNDK